MKLVLGSNHGRIKMPVEVFFAEQEDTWDILELEGKEGEGIFSETGALEAFARF